MRARGWPRRLAAGLILWALLAGPARADDRPARLSLGQPDKSGFPNMELTALVLNGADVPVVGLDEANFELVEDGKTVPVTSVEEVTTNASGVVVVLGLDVSGSMRGEPQRDAAAALTRFVERLGPADQAALVPFGVPIPRGAPCFADTGAGLTRNKDMVIAGIADARGGGNTPLYDATLAAVQLAAAAPQGRRIVVMLTDGEDTCSATSPSILVEAAVSNKVPVYFVGLGPDLNAPLLTYLANLTGGEYLPVDASSRLGAVYEDLSRRLRTQYLLRYRSQQLADLQEHVIRVHAGTSDSEAVSEARFTPPKMAPELSVSVVDGQEIGGPTAIEVTTETPLQLVKADYFLDGVLLHTRFGAPLTFTLDPQGIRTGPHTVVIEVTDNTGEVTVATVNVMFPSRFPWWIFLAVALTLPILIIVLVFGTAGGRRAVAVPRIARAGAHASGTQEGPASPAHAQPGRESAGWLEVRSGADIGARFPLTGARTTIGRDAVNDIVLNDAAASRNHAVVEAVNGSLYIVDLRTTNGTKLNGLPVLRQRLQPGDVISIGETMLALERAS